MFYETIIICVKCSSLNCHLYDNPNDDDTKPYH